MSSEDCGSGHDGSGGLAAGGGGGEAESPAAGERKDLQSIKGPGLHQEQEPAELDSG